MEQYIPWLLSAIAIAVSLYLGFHKENKEDNEKDNEENKNISIALAKIDVKQDSTLNAVNEMRLELKTQGTRISELEKDMILVKEGTKSAHHRIDDFINNNNNQKRKDV